MVAGGRPGLLTLVLEPHEDNLMHRAVTIPCLIACALTLACGSDSAATVAEGGAERGELQGQCQLPALPKVVMEAIGGQQEGTHGSACVGSRTMGCSACSDRRSPIPQKMTIVHPGDEVTFSMPAGSLVAGTCDPACPPTALAQRFSCGGASDPVQEIVIEQGRPWTVDLAPGEYTVFLDTHFEGADGFNGGIYVGFGLVVDAAAERMVVSASGAACAADSGVEL